MVCSAVTLEGTVIHKSGLMTGGRSTHSTGKKWEEKDYQGRNIQFSTHGFKWSCTFLQGLQRVRDALMAQMQELNKSKPRGKADENLIAEISRLESSINVTRDDLVSGNIYSSDFWSFMILFVILSTERMQASTDWHQRWTQTCWKGAQEDWSRVEEGLFAFGRRSHSVANKCYSRRPLMMHCRPRSRSCSQ